MSKPLRLFVASVPLLLAPDSHADSYVAATEVRLGIGAGADNTVEGEGGGALAFSGSLLLGVSSDWVLGPTLQHAPTIFGGANTHGGVAFGNAGHGARYWQWLVEAGIHHRSGVGTNIFTQSDAEPVDLPYLGATARWIVDLGRPEGFVIDLSLSGKRDLGASSQEARTTTCVLDCTEEESEFVVGGYHVVAGFGIGYQFPR